MSDLQWISFIVWRMKPMLRGPDYATIEIIITPISEGRLHFYRIEGITYCCL